MCTALCVEDGVFFGKGTYLRFWTGTRYLFNTIIAIVSKFFAMALVSHTCAVKQVFSLAYGWEVCAKPASFRPRPFYVFHVCRPRRLPST